MHIRFHSRLHPHIGSIFLGLILVTNVCIARAIAQPTSQKEEISTQFNKEVEQKALKNTNDNPRSEQAWLQLAQTYVDLKKYPEAKVALAELFKLNRENSDGKLLAKSVEINSNQSISKEEQAEQNIKLLNESLDRLNKSLAPLAGSLNDIEKEGEQRRSALDQKYGISRYKFQDPFIKANFDRQVLISRLLFSNPRKSDEILVLLKENEVSGPNAHGPRLALLKELIRQSKFDEAEKKLRNAQKQFPDFPELKIVADYLSQIRTAKSDEGEARLKMDLEKTLHDAATIRNDILLKQL